MATNNFSKLLNNVMGAQGLSQAGLSKLLGVSQPAVGRWLKGNKPSNRMRARVMEKLREGSPQEAPEAVLDLQRSARTHDQERVFETLRGRIAERLNGAGDPAGPVTIAINAPGLRLTMEVSEETVRRVLQVVMVNTNEQERPT